MSDPATTAILMLTAITGVSGYGMWKMNSRPDALISRKDYDRVIADVEAQKKSASIYKEYAERLIQQLKKEKNALETSKKNLESEKGKLISEKGALSKNLEGASELENTFRAVSPEVFRQAIKDFMKEADIAGLGHPEIFEPLLSRYSLTRGTAQSLFTKMSNTVDQMIAKKRFDGLLLKSLKNADRSLEQTRLEEAQAAKTKKEQEAAKATAAAVEKTAKLNAEKLRKEQEATAAAVEKTAKLNAAKEKKKQEATAAKAAKDAKEAKTLQLIVDEALKTAKLGPLTSNTVYQSIKTPFLSGVDSVARGVQKVGEVAKQVVTKTGEVISTPARLAAERKQRYQEALQRGGADTFDTDVYYRLFHPKDEDRPYRTLAYLFEKTSTDTSLARNMLPTFDAFMYWRKTVLNSPILYKPELVAAATNLFKLVEPIRVNDVFQDKELKKAIEAVGKVGTRINPMTGRTADASDVRAVKESKVEPVKEFKEIIDEPPKKGALTLRTPKGGMRKKKLRTRRGVKQNVRRTRRSQNRPNRTDTYSSRRTEVDASGDELGL